jgi:DUF917 family protein
VSTDTVFKAADIDDLARGAAFLGSGGGGDPYIGSLLLREAMKTSGDIPLISMDDVPEDALVVPTAMIGAPTVMVEKIPSGEEAVETLRRTEQAVGKKVFALMPAEIGGLNALLPFVLAARMGLPVVDADGCGRAVPHINMTTFSIYGVPVSPVTICDEHRSSVLINAVDDLAAEHLARATSTAMGAAAIMSCYPILGRQLNVAAIPRTITSALNIGRQIRQAREAREDPIERLLTYLRSSDYYKHAYLLFDGKVTDLERRTVGGFSVGTLHITGGPGSPGLMEIIIQNENLSARIDGKIVTMVPDLICIIDRETTEPITTEGLRYGQRVRVLGIGAPPLLRTAEALEVVGPDKFGIAEPYRPIETLYGQS